MSIGHTLAVSIFMVVGTFWTASVTSPSKSGIAESRSIGSLPDPKRDGVGWPGPAAQWLIDVTLPLVT